MTTEVLSVKCDYTNAWTKLMGSEAPVGLIAFVDIKITSLKSLD